MIFGCLAVILAMVFLIQCIREVNTEESENITPTVTQAHSTPELKYQRYNKIEPTAASNDNYNKSFDAAEYRSGAYNQLGVSNRRSSDEAATNRLSRGRKRSRQEIEILKQFEKYNSLTKAIPKDNQKQYFSSMSREPQSLQN